MVMPSYHVVRCFTFVAPLGVVVVFSVYLEVACTYHCVCPAFWDAKHWSDIRRISHLHVLSTALGEKQIQTMLLTISAPVLDTVGMCARSRDFLYSVVVTWLIVYGHYLNPHTSHSHITTPYIYLPTLTLGCGFVHHALPMLW